MSQGQSELLESSDTSNAKAAWLSFLYPSAIKKGIKEIVQGGDTAYNK